MMHLLLASDINLDDFFVEIYDGEELFATLSENSGEFVIYSRNDQQPWRMPMGDLLEILQKAQKRLERGSTGSH